MVLAINRLSFVLVYVEQAELQNKSLCFAVVVNTEKSSARQLEEYFNVN